MHKHIFIIVLSCCIFSSCKFRQKVSLIVHHAKIYTADKNFSIQEAMAISDGKIIALGKSEMILKGYEAENVIDAGGKAVYPGFIDAHCHFTGYATDLWKCDVTGTSSFDAVVEKIKLFAKTNPSGWIYGRGWDQNDWDVKDFPSKEKLDSLFPDRPVFLKRIDSHAALVNQKALIIAGITATTKIEGGVVELKDGQPTGLLLDNAMDMAENHIPLIEDAMARKFFLQAQDSCFSYGLTGVQDCGISEHTVDLVDAEQKAGRLKMKIFALLSDSTEYYDRWIEKGIYKTKAAACGRI